MQFADPSPKKLRRPRGYFGSSKLILPKQNRQISEFYRDVERLQRKHRAKGLSISSKTVFPTEETRGADGADFKVIRLRYLDSASTGPGEGAARKSGGAAGGVEFQIKIQHRPPEKHVLESQSKGKRPKLRLRRKSRGDSKTHSGILLPREVYLRKSFDTGLQNKLRGTRKRSVKALAALVEHRSRLFRSISKTKETYSRNVRELKVHLRKLRNRRAHSAFQRRLREILAHRKNRGEQKAPPKHRTFDRRSQGKGGARRLSFEGAKALPREMRRKASFLRQKRKLVGELRQLGRRNEMVRNLLARVKGELKREIKTRLRSAKQRNRENRSRNRARNRIFEWILFAPKLGQARPPLSSRSPRRVRPMGRIPSVKKDAPGAGAAPGAPRKWG